MSKAVEIKIYKTIVKPAVGFWSEIWTVTEKDMKRLGIWGRKILRRIHGPMAEQRMWRERTGLELRELYKDLDIVGGIERKRFEWIGPVAGMDQGRRDKKAFEFKPEESSRNGKLRLRLLENITKHLREMRFKR